MDIETEKAPFIKGPMINADFFKLVKWWPNVRKTVYPANCNNFIICFVIFQHTPKSIPGFFY